MHNQLYIFFNLHASVATEMINNEGWMLMFGGLSLCLLFLGSAVAGVNWNTLRIFYHSG